jgi:Cohesin domain
MKSVLILLLGGCLLFCGYAANSQSLCLAFAPSQVSGPVGSLVQVNAVAVTLDEIAAMQFPILYDKNVLELQALSIPSPAPLPNFYYNPGFISSMANPVPGKITLVWFDSLGYGNSVTPGTVLFSMQFKIIGTGVSSVEIVDAPPPSIEVLGGIGGGPFLNFTNPCVTTLGKCSRFGCNGCPQPIFFGYHIDNNCC